MREGKEIINKVEEYKKVNNRLPNSLSDMGIEEHDGMDALYYYKRDSINYTVSFPISAEKHKFYYSDSQKWEDGYRDMK
jgi:effector-binding domain-containing protein